jgi:RNA polymerase sigma-70 factor (ECF subfamily)
MGERGYGEHRGPHTGKLLEQALQGDVAAQAAVFGPHRAQLLAQTRGHPLMRFLRQTTTPDDLVDEVFLRALGSGLLQRFEDRGPGSLRKVLTRVLERTLLDACRRLGAAKRAPSLWADPLSGASDDGEAGTPPQLSHWTTPTSRARIDELMGRCRRILSEREFAAWILVEVDELDSTAAGKRLDLSPSAVRGLVSRARDKLVENLRAERDGGI